MPRVDGVFPLNPQFVTEYYQFLMSIFAETLFPEFGILHGLELVNTVMFPVDFPFNPWKT